jgi:DNA-binding transcriptional ArsR family regulator
MLTYKFVSVCLHNVKDLMRRDVFQAIADPNRRAILGMLANNQLNVNQVADHFDITRSAVSQHIKILTGCGLVVVNKKGRERYCEAKLDKLSEIQEWLNQYKKFWEGKFDVMETILMELQSKNKKYDSKK